MLPLPLELCPEAVLPAPVLAVFEPEPCAFVVPVGVGFVLVLDPVPLLAAPVEGAEVFEPLPDDVDELLPVVAVAVEPLEPADVVEEVVVVAVAPPVEVGLGVGVGAGVGDGVGVGVAAVVPVEMPVHQFAAPPVLTPFCGVEEGFEFDVAVGVGVGAGVVLGVGVGVGLGVGVGVGVGMGVLVPAEEVVVVDEVEVPDDPPLIDGSTLITGRTSMVGELPIEAMAVALIRNRPW